MKAKNKKINFKDQLVRQKIVEALNLSNLTKIQQDKVIFMLIDNVCRKINIVMWDKLSEEEKKEVKNILNKSGREKVLNYINYKMKNFPKLVENITRQTTDDFKKKKSKI